ncbi:hypothetical protein F5Y02DRAFT_238934 [Annulohypoxylon stygium]|nr:hypothetical protein F5Y02DRAFT_238934 [Annulohypoxylon stygium]
MPTPNCDTAAQETMRFLWSQRLVRLRSPDGEPVFQYIRKLEEKPNDKKTIRDKASKKESDARPVSATAQDQVLDAFPDLQNTLAYPDFKDLDRAQGDTRGHDSAKSSTSGAVITAQDNDISNLISEATLSADVSPTRTTREYVSDYPATLEPSRPVFKRENGHWKICGWPSIGGRVISEANAISTDRTRDPYQKAEDAFCRKLMACGARYVDEKGCVWVCQNDNRFQNVDVPSLLAGAGNAGHAGPSLLWREGTTRCR